MSSVDELVIILRRKSGLRFDEKLPGFHLYGADIVQTALARRLGAYVIDAPVVHNDKRVKDLGREYGNAYRYLQRKWRERLPIPTTIAPITRWGVPLWRVRMRDWVMRRRKGVRYDELLPDPVDIARRLGYE